jgi:hypothetical protein
MHLLIRHNETEDQWHKYHDDKEGEAHQAGRKRGDIAVPCPIGRHGRNANVDFGSIDYPQSY